MLNKIINLGIGYADAMELVKVSFNIQKDYKKLLKGYPIQYLIGYSSFCGYKINVDKNVLIPRFETELLVEKVAKYIQKYLEKDINVVDVGTGSGCIAIAIKKILPYCKIDAIDNSSKAINVAKINANENKVNINFIKSDMLCIVTKKYDVIISNPPYISLKEKIDKSVKKYEPHKALYARKNGLYFYDKILNKAVNCVTKKSIIAFEIGCSQGKELTRLARMYFPKSKILIQKDLTKRDRFVFILNNIE